VPTLQNWIGFRMNNEKSVLTIKIVYSEGEASISGSPQSLREVNQFMMNFTKSDRSKDIIATLSADPAPYDRCLNFLTIRKDSGAIKVSVVDDRLEVIGDSSRIETFSDWFDFSDNTFDGYHHHHDCWCGEEWVHPQSMPLVIMCKSK
jgi:hypothetical protein